MSDILTALQSIFTTVIGMVGSVVNTITSNPLLLFFAILGVSMIAVGVVKRLLSVN